MKKIIKAVFIGKKSNILFGALILVAVLFQVVVRYKKYKCSSTDWQREVSRLDAFSAREYMQRHKEECGMPDMYKRR